MKFYKKHLFAPYQKFELAQIYINSMEEMIIMQIKDKRVVERILDFSDCEYFWGNPPNNTGKIRTARAIWE